MPEQSSVVIAVLNSKGGVGKTTAAVNLSAALASSRRHVLLVDLDSQASASLWLGLTRKTLTPSTASCLLDKYPILKAVRHTSTPNLDLLPGSIELANADVALGAQRGRESALRRMIDRVAQHYDAIVLDCPPGVSLLGVNAIVASDALVVPVSPEPLAVENLELLFASLDRVRTRMGSPVRILGLLLGPIDPQRRHTREVAERLRAEYRERVFHTEIRWTTALSDAPAAHQTVLQFAPKSASADAFRRLAGEVLQRLPAILHSTHN